MSGEGSSADPLLEASSALGWLSAWIPERGCRWVALCIDSGCLVYIYLCSAKSLGFRFPRPKFKFWLFLLLLAKLLFLSVSWPLYCMGIIALLFCIIVIRDSGHECLLKAVKGFPVRFL